MKKVLAIMGSPRASGNTAQALGAFVEGMRSSDIEVEVIEIRKLNISDCIDCRYCFQTGECIIDDDMQMIYDKFNEVDGVVVAAPTYYNSINGMAKNLVDRTQRYYGIKYGYGREKVYIRNKIGYVLSVGGADYTDYQFTGTNLAMDHFFKSINAKKIGSYYISETDQMDTKDKTEIMDELRDLGSKFFTNDKFWIQKVK